MSAGFLISEMGAVFVITNGKSLTEFKKSKRVRNGFGQIMLAIAHVPAQEAQ